MSNRRPAGRKKRRVFRRFLTLLLTAAIGAGAWTYLRPYLVEGSMTHYEAYTVERGDIATAKSFSATLSEGGSEVLYNTTEAESVKKLYVTGGQEVREGDKLMELSDGTVLEAGIDGVVNEIRYAEGDWLRRNVQLVEICDLENLRVSLKIDEYDIDKIAVGQKCIITVVPVNCTIETELTHVSRLSSSTGRVAYYSATAEVTAPENVFPGMTASVSIPDAAAMDVLTLDMAALSFDGEDNPYVLRKTEEGYEQIPVETGLSDGMKVEIISGLHEGDQVWKAAGEEEITFDFSLTEIYKKIFGETVIINEERGAGRNSRGGGAGMGGARPEGMTFPEGMQEGEYALQPPSGMPSPGDAAAPGGMSQPGAAEQPRQ